MPIQKEILADRLRSLRHECLFNSSVMFAAVRRKKSEIKRKSKEGKAINIAVVVLTLFATGFLMLELCEVVSTLSSLIAFGLSIYLLILHGDEPDTRVHYSAANNYWILYQRAHDLLKVLLGDSVTEDQLQMIRHKTKCLASQAHLLVRTSPVFNEEDEKNAKKAVLGGKYLYHGEDDLTEITDFFKNRCTD